MTARKALTAGELEGLYAKLDRLLDSVGLETQPKIAVRVLELAQNPEAQLREFGDVIRTDWSLSGRLLRLANSAFYAQRVPVTTLDRALVLLGLERTKAITLGFYLSRAALAPNQRELSRQVWRQSIYRASLCSSLSRRQCPGRAAEAFVVGLLLDCGQPLMAAFYGDEYVRLWERTPDPASLLSLESELFEYTHVDVVASLARRWKLPPMLARPIAWHHTLPSASMTTDPNALLQRIAYYTGAVRILTPEEGSPSFCPKAGDRVLGIDRSELEAAVKSASVEYQATIAVFSHLGDEIADLDRVASAVQHQLVEIMDEQLSRSIRVETRGTERFAIGGQQVEVEPGSDGEVVAYITGERGDRIISCVVRPEAETAESIGRILGIGDAAVEQLEELVTVMRSMAA